MKGSGVDLYQYNESLLRASRARAERHEVGCGGCVFSRAAGSWMHCPVRRAVMHHAEAMILTSMLNTLWYLPFLKPANWDEADERTQREYTKDTEYLCPTIVFDHFCDKFASR